MKIKSAEFTITDVHGEFTITFTFSDGKPRLVVVSGPGVDLEIDNRLRNHKPCVTHCKYLIDHKTGKPPKNEHAKNLAKKSKPELRLLG